MAASQHEVTALLRQWRSGDQKALGKLTPLMGSSVTLWPGPANKQKHVPARRIIDFIKFAAARRLYALT